MHDFIFMLNCDLFFLQDSTNRLTEWRQGFPVGRDYVLTHGITGNWKHKRILQTNIVTKHCKKWCLLSPPPYKSSEANESVGGGEANLSKTLTSQKKGFFLVPPPLPSSDAYTHCKKRKLFPSENMFSSAGFRIHLFYDRMTERKKKERKKINKLLVPNLAIVLIAI